MSSQATGCPTTPIEDAGGPTISVSRADRRLRRSLVPKGCALRWVRSQLSSYRLVVPDYLICQQKCGSVCNGLQTRSCAIRCRQTPKNSGLSAGSWHILGTQRSLVQIKSPRFLAARAAENRAGELASRCRARTLAEPCRARSCDHSITVLRRTRHRTLAVSPAVTVPILSPLSGYS